jgi:hypothetical protein
MVDVRQAHRVTGGDRFTAVLPKLLADVAREATVQLVAARIATAFIVALQARTARVYLTGIDRRTLHLTAAKNVDAGDVVADPNGRHR